MWQEWPYLCSASTAFLTCPRSVLWSGRYPLSTSGGCIPFRNSWLDLHWQINTRAKFWGICSLSLSNVEELVHWHLIVASYVTKDKESGIQIPHVEPTQCGAYDSIIIHQYYQDYSTGLCMALLFSFKYFLNIAIDNPPFLSSLSPFQLPTRLPKNVSPQILRLWRCRPTKATGFLVQSSSPSWWSYWMCRSGLVDTDLGLIGFTLANCWL